MADIMTLHRAAASARTARDDRARDGASRTRCASTRSSSELARAPRAARRRATARMPSTRGERWSANKRLSAPTVAAAARDLATGRERTTATLGPFFRRSGEPRRATRRCVPFLLFPVRIETKFCSAQDGGELRVRIFPDDIAVAHHEKALTVGEKDAGESLLARACGGERRAGHAGARDKLQRDAWNRDRLALQRLSGQLDRAMRRSRTTGPTPSPIPTTLDFPGRRDQAAGLERHAALAGHARRVRGRARTRDGRRARCSASWCRTILPLGPDPLQAEGFLTRDADDTASEDLRRPAVADRLRRGGSGRDGRADPADARGDDGGLRSHSRPRPAARPPIAEASAALLSRPGRKPPLQPGDVDRAAGRADQQHRRRAVGPDDRRTRASTRPTRSSTTRRRFRCPTEPMRAAGRRAPRRRARPADRRASARCRTRADADIAESVAMNRALWSAHARLTSSTEMLQGTFSAADIATRADVPHRVRARPRAGAGDPRRRAAVRHRDHERVRPTGNGATRELGDDGDFWDRAAGASSVLLRDHWRTVVATARCRSSASATPEGSAARSVRAR